MSLTLRPATMDDSDFLFTLRNDPLTRAMSSSMEPIERAHHEIWLERWLNKRDLIAHEGIYIAEVTGTYYGIPDSKEFKKTIPVGTGRIERSWSALSLKMDSCRLGYSIDPALRGNGYGKQLVAALVKEAQRMGYCSICCRIRRENISSLMCAVMGGVNAVELF